MTRRPMTAPSWSNDGRYSLLVGDEHRGYFRQFRSAFAWREYVRATEPDVREVRILDRSDVVNIWRRPEDVR